MKARLHWLRSGLSTTLEQAEETGILPAMKHVRFHRLRRGRPRKGTEPKVFTEIEELVPFLRSGDWTNYPACTVHFDNGEQVEAHIEIVFGDLHLVVLDRTLIKVTPEEV